VAEVFVLSRDFPAAKGVTADVTMAQTVLGRRILICVLVALTWLARPVLAAAADEAEIAGKISKMNAKAIEEYENLNFDEARKILEKALEIAAQNGLDHHPITARTHLHLGVVLLAGGKEHDLAIKQMGQALDIQPDIQMTKRLANPEIQSVFDDVVKSRTAPPPPPTEVEDALDHAPIKTAPQGGPIAIQVAVNPTVSAKKLALAFRPEGSPEFVKHEMTEESPGHWTGEIPASATNGGDVAYYIEAQNDAGDRVASKGNADEPMVVTLGAARRRRVVPPKQPARPVEAEGPRWLIGMALGGGAGWTSGTGEVNPADVVTPSGVAPSQLAHLAPEVGYFLRPGFMLSAQLRLQYVTGATTMMCSTGTCAAPKTALAGFARATWLFGAEKLHPYFAAIAGGGDIRHVAEFKSHKTCGDPSNPVVCVDTLTSGPVFAGAGVGLFYNTSDSFALTLGLSTLAGFPTFTVQMDVNGGIAVEF
jgi:hypothetical protein